ncbi:Alp7A family actin-like protein, partial [Escherichia sp. HC-CC]
EVVLTDIGGGSTDAVRLGKGLTTPKHRDSFQVIDIEPFLGYIDRFRKEKVLQYFKDLSGTYVIILTHLIKNTTIP